MTNEYPASAKQKSGYLNNDFDQSFICVDSYDRQTCVDCVSSTLLGCSK